MNENFFRKGIFEALFLWQRSEFKYSEALKKAFSGKHDEESLNFFAENTFAKFLADYSIRRTLPGEGIAPVQNLVKEIFAKNGLLEALKNGEEKGKAIQDFIDKIKDKKELSKGKKLTSLVSKTAFLFMPESLPLYDQLTKNALEKNYGRISNFKDYLKAFEQQKSKWDGEVRRHLEDMLHVTTLFSEFKNISDIRSFLAHRTVDKLLWIEGKSLSENT